MFEQIGKDKLFSGKVEKDALREQILVDLNMYELPGDKLTYKDVDRYLESRLKVVTKMKEDIGHFLNKGFSLEFFSQNERADLIRSLLESGDVRARLVAVDNIRLAPENERADLIRLGLEDEEERVRREAIWNAPFVSESDRVRLESMFVNSIRSGLENSDVRARLMAVESIRSAPENEIADLIRLGLDDVDIGVKRGVFQDIQFVPENERADLIRLGLEDTDISVKWYAIENIKFVPEDKRAGLEVIVLEIVKSELEDGMNKKIIIQNIRFLPENERANFLRLALEDEDEEIRSEAVYNIRFLPENERTYFIRLGLEDVNIGVIWGTVGSIQFAPENERADLIRLALEDVNISVKWRASEYISLVPEAERAELSLMVANIIKSVLEGDDEDNKLDAIRNIRYVSENERADLIRLGLEDVNFSVKWRASEYISLVPEAERAELSLMVANIIKSVLEGDDEDNKLGALRNIRFVPENERADLIRLALEDEDEEIRLEAVYSFEFVPVDQRADLIRLGLEDEDEEIRLEAVENIKSLSKDELLEFQKEKSGELGELAKGTHLYSKARDSFLRKEFEKDGSETTLLDIIPGNSENTLREKVIIRHIKIRHYLAWDSLYKAVDFWKGQGFDYVPIESIVKVKLRNENNIDVFCRVLNGPNYYEWSVGSYFLYNEEIEEVINRIKKALKEFGVEHGHSHHSNFVLVFDRDQNGDPVLEKMPKVYLIDFDEAEFFQEDDL